VSTLLVGFLVACAWTNYRLKTNRMEREDTFMYKIYFDIITKHATEHEGEKEDLIKEIHNNLKT